MATATPAAAAPAQPVAAPTDTSGFGDAGVDTTDAAPAADDKPFDDEPFDAGVAADEETDPKKYIEQLTGKLGQSLRKYNEEQGQPDFELEKFAINSLLSATHTSEMDEEDKKDIIKKVNTAGNDESNDSDMGTQDDTDSGENNNDGTDDSNSGDSGFGTEDDVEDLEEYTIYENENFILPGQGKRMSIFAPEGSEEFMEINRLDEKNVVENLINKKKNSIFDKSYLTSKLHESFNQNNMKNSEPIIAPEPVTKPTIKPVETPAQPSRRNKPFTVQPSVQPDPKAIKEGKFDA